MKFRYPSLILYLSMGSLLLAWWYFAFLFPSQQVQAKTLYPLQQNASVTPKILHYLFPLDRDAIQKALSGDTHTIARLITEWQMDAALLKQHQLSKIKALSKEKFLRAQKILRALQLFNDQHFANKTVVTDDRGVEFHTEKHFEKLLPQTFVSASFLLALAEPESIAALPEGFRNSSGLFFPKEMLDKIPVDINRYSREKIFQCHPEIAFVADYSHPATIEALKCQNVCLFTLKGQCSTDSICSAIQRIGQVINCPLKAELLSIFIESAMLSIDNRLLANVENLVAPRILFVQYSSEFSLPTNRTITGQLLERLEKLGCNFVAFDQITNEGWKIPISQETITSFDLDSLIISTSHDQILEKEIYETKHLSSLSEITGDRIYFIDKEPFSPTQFVVLAYYDLANSIIKATKDANAVPK